MVYFMENPLGLVGNLQMVWNYHGKANDSYLRLGNFDEPRTFYVYVLGDEVRMTIKWLVIGGHWDGFGPQGNFFSGGSVTKLSYAW